MRWKRWVPAEYTLSLSFVLFRFILLLHFSLPSPLLPLFQSYFLSHFQTQCSFTLSPVFVAPVTSQVVFTVCSSLHPNFPSQWGIAYWCWQEDSRVTSELAGSSFPQAYSKHTAVYKWAVLTPLCATYSKCPCLLNLLRNCSTQRKHKQLLVSISEALVWCTGLNRKSQQYFLNFI